MVSVNFAKQYILSLFNCKFTKQYLLRQDGKTRGCYCSCWGPDDGREDAQNMLSCTQMSSNKFEKLLHLVGWFIWIASWGLSSWPPLFQCSPLHLSTRRTSLHILYYRKTRNMFHFTELQPQEQSAT